MIRVTIFGKTKEECAYKLEEYLERYSFAGYGTEVLSAPEYEPVADIWKARVQRYTHCE